MVWWREPWFNSIDSHSNPVVWFWERHLHSCIENGRPEVGGGSENLSWLKTTHSLIRSFIHHIGISTSCVSENASQPNGKISNTWFLPSRNFQSITYSSKNLALQNTMIIRKLISTGWSTILIRPHATWEGLPQCSQMVLGSSSIPWPWASSLIPSSLHFLVPRTGIIRSALKCWED